MYVFENNHERGRRRGRAVAGTKVPVSLHHLNPKRPKGCYKTKEPPPKIEFPFFALLEQRKIADDEKRKRSMIEARRAIKHSSLRASSAVTPYFFDHPLCVKIRREEEMFLFLISLSRSNFFYSPRERERSLWRENT